MLTYTSQWGTDMLFPNYGNTLFDHHLYLHHHALRNIAQQFDCTHDLSFMALVWYTVVDGDTCAAALQVL